MKKQLSIFLSCILFLFGYSSLGSSIDNDPAAVDWRQFKKGLEPLDDPKYSREIRDYSMHLFLGLNARKNESQMTRAIDFAIYELAQSGSPDVIEIARLAIDPEYLRSAAKINKVYGKELKVRLTTLFRAAGFVAPFYIINVNELPQMNLNLRGILLTNKIIRSMAIPMIGGKVPQQSPAKMSFDKFLLEQNDPRAMEIFGR